jgi:predicted heme/steroid binding protein
MYFSIPIFNPCQYCRNTIYYCNYRTLGEFTLSELAYNDGSMGKSAYVAVNGIVYDVSNEAAWGGASHFGLIAGKDLTSQFKGCHGSESILAKLPKVGILKK